MSAMGERIDARVIDQFPSQVLRGALPGEFAADLHFRQAQIIDRHDHDQPFGAL